VLTGLISEGLLILIHELVSAIGAYGMGDAMIILHIIGQKFFPAKMFAAP